MLNLPEVPWNTCGLLGRVINQMSLIEQGLETHTARPSMPPAEWRPESCVLSCHSTWQWPGTASDGACYQHACLKYVSNEVLTNGSLRQRFEISEGNSAQASRIIAETVDAGLIKQSNPDNKSRKLMQYQPFWA